MISSLFQQGFSHSKKSVKQFFQYEVSEWGVVCLKMILEYWGKTASIEELRSTCGVSRNGCRALDIVNAAKLYDMDAIGLNVEINEISNVDCPCIIHWNFNHFVVLTELNDKQANINDPAIGHIKVPIQTFKESFTGVMIKISPSENFKEQHKKAKVGSSFF